MCIIAGALCAHILIVAGALCVRLFSFLLENGVLHFSDADMDDDDNNDNIGDEDNGHWDGPQGFPGFGGQGLGGLGGGGGGPGAMLG